MKGLVILLCVLTAVAGCLDRGSPGDQAAGAATEGAGPERFPLPEDPMAEGPGHNHQDASQHKFLWNYEFSARDPLGQNEVNTAGVHALDVQAGYLFAAVYGSHTVAVDGGLVIWDLADPAHPKQTGRWTIPGSVGGDRSMEATPDGDFAVISTELRDCAGHVNPFGAVSAYLVDARDKANPVPVDVITSGGTLSSPAMPLGASSYHSVAVHRIRDVDYAFLSGAIYRIDRTETGGALSYVGHIPVGHDMYVRDTPWNTTWALVANGGGGMVVHDVTDPAAPFELAVWDLENRDEGPERYFHTADVSFLPGGQILFVLTSEDWGDAISPFWVLDGNPLRDRTEATADPVLLEALGQWTNPGNHSALSGLTFSLHNPRFHDGGVLTLGSYHGGMWQFDLRHPAFWSDPAPMAYAAYADGKPTQVQDPVEDQNACGLDFKLDAPSYWDVEIGEDGVVYMADAFMGLYTFVPSPGHPVFGGAAPGSFRGTAGV